MNQFYWQASRKSLSYFKDMDGFSIKFSKYFSLQFTSVSKMLPILLLVWDIRTQILQTELSFRKKKYPITRGLLSKKKVGKEKEIISFTFVCICILLPFLTYKYNESRLQERQTNQKKKKIATPGISLRPLTPNYNNLQKLSVQVAG